jgi:putative peptidoglycan lipid II flippase
MTSKTKSSVDRKLARGVGGFGAAVMLSRLLGYARDAAIAAAFGGGALTDTFYAAFRIANFFRRTLAEGALASSVVPVLASEAQKGEEEARRFSRSLTTAVLALAGGVALAGVVFARPLATALAYGFTREPKLLELTVVQTRILFPFLVFAALTAVLQAALNVRGSFFAPAAAPSFFSLSILVYLGSLRLGLPVLTTEGRLYGLAAAAMLGGALTLAALARPALEAGFEPRLGPLEHPGVRAVGALMLPSFIALAADHVGLFVNTVCASFLEAGSITAVYNSSRLMQLPLGLFGAATAAVALPELSAHAGRKDEAAYNESLRRSLRLVSFLLWPSTVGLQVISLPLVRLLFEHGRFTFDASVMTHKALVLATPAIFAYAASKVLVSGFYALHDSATPAKAGVGAALLNAALAPLFMGPLRVGGLMLASSIAAWVQFFWLLKKLQDRTSVVDLPLVESFARSLAAALVMGVAARVAMLTVSAEPAAQAAAALVVAPVVYYGASIAFGIEERLLVWELLPSAQ